MLRAVPIVQARRELGRIAEDVRRTGQPVVLTKRGRPVARITPEPPPARGRHGGYDALGELRGTVQMNGTFAELVAATRKLRREGARNLAARADLFFPRKP